MEDKANDADGRNTPSSISRIDPVDDRYVADYSSDTSKPDELPSPSCSDERPDRSSLSDDVKSTDPPQSIEDDKATTSPHQPHQEQQQQQQEPEHQRESKDENQTATTDPRQQKEQQQQQEQQVSEHSTLIENINLSIEDDNLSLNPHHEPEHQQAPKPEDQSRTLVVEGTNQTDSRNNASADTTITLSLRYEYDHLRSIRFLLSLNQHWL